MKCWLRNFASITDILLELRPAMEVMGIKFKKGSYEFSPKWIYMVSQLPGTDQITIDIAEPPSPRNINGILVPAHQCYSNPPPSRCKGLIQHWVEGSDFCCLTPDKTELIVFSKLYMDQFDPQILTPDSEDEELEMWDLMQGKVTMERIQAENPRSHPSLQEFYGLASKGFFRFEPAIGKLFYFIAMYDKKDVPGSARYDNTPADI